MNNFEYAQEIENNVKKAILSDLNSDVEKKFAEKIFDELLVIEPREDENNIITIDMSSHYSEETKGISCKLSNIRLNLKVLKVTMKQSLTVSIKTLNLVLRGFAELLVQEQIV